MTMITQQELDKFAKAIYSLQLENGFDNRVDHFFDFLSECGYTVSKQGSAAKPAEKGLEFVKSDHVKGVRVFERGQYIGHIFSTGFYPDDQCDTLTIAEMREIVGQWEAEFGKEASNE